MSPVTPWLEELCAIATDAGRRILEIYGSFDQPVLIKSKDDGSPLTIADRAANDIIVDRLQRFAPDIPVLSEESARAGYETRRHWGRFFLVDPLDGTREFLNRNGEFTVNIALIENGRPVLGAVYVPVTGVCYLGAQGAGAWKQHAGVQTPIRVRDYRGGRATVVASRSHAGPETERFLAKLAECEGSYDTASLGSSLKLCLVAEGAADIYPRLGPTSEWDTAAAHCVVEAAGGHVVNLAGDPLVYNKPDILNPYFLAIGGGSYNWLDYFHGDR